MWQNHKYSLISYTFFTWYKLDEVWLVTVTYNVNFYTYLKKIKVSSEEEQVQTMPKLK